MSKPDLSMYSPGIREAIIKRRAKKLAERGMPSEIWDSKNARLVEFNQFVAEAVAAGIVEAVARPTSPKTPIREVAPDRGPGVRESGPNEPAAAPVKPYHQMSLDEFREAAQPHFNPDYRRPPGHSPFWSTLNGEASD